MICKPCIDAPRGQCKPTCVNTAKGTKTWCDCQHESGPMVDQKSCGHLSWTDDNSACPTCGLTWKQFYQRQSSAAIAEATEGASNDG